MRMFRIVCGVCALAAVMVPSRSSAQSPTRQRVGDINFTVAAGFEVRQVADATVIQWPIVADWDPRGHLVVAESAGVSKPIADSNQLQQHKIVRLIDSNQDGVFDTRLVAADGLGFPEGVLCLGNDVLVSVPPVIWKLTDADGDGVCESREVWFDGGTLTGCANDLHGPYLGRDGWIYWTKGAFAQQTHQLPDGRELVTTAAHLFRKPLDGGPIEMVVAGGMDNPVGIAFAAGGEKFFSSTFLHHPGGGLRDGIAHAVYGGLFGKRHAVLDTQRWTGDLMPIMIDLGPAAPSGLRCLEQRGRFLGDRQPADAPISLVAALFNLQKVTLHHLRPDGATFASENIDLLVADRIDFHPTDVLQAGDGSLLCIDTGGWYDLCCPTSLVDQQAAAGGIYRIARTDQDPNALPPNDAILERWTTAETVQALSDPRPWIRRAALQRLPQCGDEATELLAKIYADSRDSLESRLTACWGLSRLGTSRAFKVIAAQIPDGPTELMTAALHALGLHRVDTAVQVFQQCLVHDSAHVRRAAAEALGRVGGLESVSPLLSALPATSEDRFLEHSILYALQEIRQRNAGDDWWAWAKTARQQRAVLLTLAHAGPDPCFDRQLLLATCMDADTALRSTAAAIVQQHPQWAETSAAELQALFNNVTANEGAGLVLQDILRGWKQTAIVRELVGEWLADASSKPLVQQQFLSSWLVEMLPSPAPSGSADRLASWLLTAPDSIRPDLVCSIGQLRFEGKDQETMRQLLLAEAAGQLHMGQRAAILAALPHSTQLPDSRWEQDLVTMLTAGSAGDRSSASKALVRLKLSATAAAALMEQLSLIAPAQMAVALETIVGTGDEKLIQQMLNRLPETRAAKTLPEGLLTSLVRRFSPAVQRQAAEIDQQLATAPQDVRQHVALVLSQLPEGDPAGGLQVFHGSKAACGSCHQLGYVGGDLGPELTKIGRSRTAEALLESILFPSARLEQSYQSTRILTTDGQLFNGFIRQQNDQILRLQIDATRTVSIELQEIEEMSPSDVSLMPGGLAQQLTRKELADLLAMLQAAK